MNYPQSQEILSEINKANKVLVNLHRGPDPDSFACAFSLYYFLCSLKKEVDVVVTSHSKLSEELIDFPESNLVKFVDYEKFDFSNYDLFIASDSGSWQQIVDDPNVKIPKISIMVIDHHATNDKFGKINLIEEDAASCAEIIYKLFEDWEFPINKDVANLLMLGIISDTGGFAFSDSPQSLKIGASLIEKGAQKTKILNKIFRTKKFEILKYWGEYLMRMEFDKEHKFIWTALPYEVDKKYGIQKSEFSTMFAGIVDGSSFGIVMTEDEPKSLKISLRSRSGIDVSKMAEELGGGGHKMAAGGMVEGLPFEKAVEKVLEVARKYSK